MLKRRQGFTLIELLVAVIIIGLMSSMAVFNYRGMLDNSKNVTVDSNVKIVVISLEKYRTDFGVLPVTDLIGTDDMSVAATPKTYLVDVTSQHQYLPFNRLPKAPWGSLTQTASITYPDNLPHNFVQAKDAGGSSHTSVRAVVNSVLDGSPVDPATLASGNAFTDHTYGAILYSVNGNVLAVPPTGTSDTYVLAGVGKHGGKAMIAAETSNAN